MTLLQRAWGGAYSLPMNEMVRGRERGRKGNKEKSIEHSCLYRLLPNNSSGRFAILLRVWEVRTCFLKRFLPSPFLSLKNVGPETLLRFLFNFNKFVLENKKQTKEIESSRKNKRERENSMRQHHQFWKVF